MASVVTPGNFDGVHVGHRALVSTAIRVARERDAQAVSMFFDPHPTSFFAPERSPSMLTTPQRRAEILRGVGIDEVDVRVFNDEFAAQSPEEFVTKVLIEEHDSVNLVVGTDFRFGKGRVGDIDLLESMARGLGIDVYVVAPVWMEGGVVSSTRIRGLVAKGEMQRVSRLMDRVHDIEGVVVKGDQRGRTIGFPTANLRCDGGTLPGDGVYAVKVKVADELIDGVANIGVRPTFEAGRSVEVHLLDVSPDLYEQRLRVGFVARVRGEQKFDGVEALKAQIERDIEQARRYLGAVEPGFVELL